MNAELLPATKPKLFITATQSDAAALRLRQIDAERLDSTGDANAALLHYSGHDCYLVPTDAMRAEFAQLAARLVSLGNVVHVAPTDSDAAMLTADQCKPILAPLPVEKRVRGPAKGSASDTTREKWRALGLHIASNGQPTPNIDNAVRAMEHSDLPIWWDEFLQRGMTEWNTDTREVRDADFVDLTIWMQRDLEMRTISLRTVTAAAESYLRANVRNCAQDWVRGLKWDGTPRLASLAVDGFGTVDDTYHRAVLRCFIMGMVKRVLEPGCQVDNVPVFESPEGRRKSSALRILGGKWFAECHEEITGKDFLQIMPGKMLLEVAELHSFRRADIERIKGIITNRVDRYRASYGRTAQDHPRMCVMAGTTNRDDWNNSDTGARRFWPIICGIIDLDWLIANREQLFAEAAALVIAGMAHWDVPADIAAEHVKARQAGDAWDGLIERYCDSRKETTVEDIMRDCLEIDKQRASNADATRVRSVLRNQGWRNVVAKREGKCVRVWQRNYAAGVIASIAPPAPQAPIPEPAVDNREFESDCPF